MNIFSIRRLMAAAIALSVFSLPGSGGALAAGVSSVSSVRLFILDCGTIAPMNPASFGLKPEEIKGNGGFVTPCYLIVHPKGTLLWEMGQVPDADIPDNGTEVLQQDVLKATRRLGSQLMALGYRPNDITYVAMSHSHTDHTANANMFAGATWVVQQAEYDVMFKNPEAGAQVPDSYRNLKNARRITLANADYDVFGDGTVIIKTAPGHTAGHQILFLKLARFGPLLLSGDLYHFPEQRSLDRVPVFDVDAAKTRASRRAVDQFLKQTGARLWIQHDPGTNAGLKGAPGYYD